METRCGDAVHIHEEVVLGIDESKRVMMDNVSTVVSEIFASGDRACD